MNALSPHRRTSRPEPKEDKEEADINGLDIGPDSHKSAYRDDDTFSGASHDDEKVARTNDTTPSHDLGINDEESSISQNEVEDQLIVDNDEREYEEEAEESGDGAEVIDPVEIAVDILTPSTPRRIHPFPSLVLSLIAIAAAYFVLHQSGPKY